MTGDFPRRVVWLGAICVLLSGCVGDGPDERFQRFNALGQLEAVEYLIEGTVASVEAVEEDGWEGNDLATVVVTSEVWSTPTHFELDELTDVAVPGAGDEVAVVIDPEVVEADASYFFGVAHVGNTPRDGSALFVFDKDWAPVEGEHQATPPLCWA